MKKHKADLGPESDAGLWQPRQRGRVYWRGPAVRGGSSRMTSPGAMARVATRWRPTVGELTSLKGLQEVLWWGHMCLWWSLEQ